jgi:ubiquinone/menaquinone biosynthesis C-methylase UbiE
VTFIRRCWSSSRISPPGRILDVPAGHGAFAQELLKQRGHGDIDCLDIGADAFALRDFRACATTGTTSSTRCPFPTRISITCSASRVSSTSRIPGPSCKELCRVLKPGGRLIISTPNTFSVDARVKYLLSGYYPRFRP